MPFETLFSCRLKVKAQGSYKGQNGHNLSLCGPLLVHFCMDFKIILHGCCPRGGKVPFKNIFR